MSPAQRLLLAALLLARPGWAGEHPAAHKEAADARSLEQQSKGGSDADKAKAHAAGASNPAAKEAKDAGSPKQDQRGSESANEKALEKFADEAATGDQLEAGEKLYSLATAKAFAAMAKLAYCGPGPVPWAPYGNPTVLPKLVPASCGKACNDAGFQLKKTLLVTHPGLGQKNAEFAYVSRVDAVKGGHRAPADCAVSFRGAWVLPANDVASKNATLVDFASPSCQKGCQVVGGAFQVWQDLAPGILKSLGQLGCGKGSSVAVTGHGMGGQVASIAMFFLQDLLHYKVALSYTFNQPRPFNRKAAEKFETLFPDRAVSLFRITMTNDEVARQPHPTCDDYWHPGYQVWHYSYENDFEYRLCGTQMDRPHCGVHGLLAKELCKPTDDNDEVLECGGYAPYNGPHCRSVLAPAQSMCSFAGNSELHFESFHTAVCISGEPMPYEVTHMTQDPPVFPHNDIPDDPDDMSGGKQASKAALALPPGMQLEKEDDEAYKGSGSKGCFKENTASSPLSMFGHYIEIVDSVEACQKRCADTAYCEMFTYYPIKGGGGKGGGCDLTGGWGQYVPGIMGSVAGPKECAKKPPKLSESQRYQLLQDYMNFIGQQYDGNYALGYERREGGAGLTGPRGFSLAQVACFGASMLAVGAGATLLVARTGRLAGVLGLRPAAPSRLSWAAADERGLVPSEE